MKFEIFKTRNNQWRWRLRAPNGKIVANAGESYHRAIDCTAAINLVEGTDRNTPRVKVSK